jgi:transcription initiation factor IIE alpha subunit
MGDVLCVECRSRTALPDSLLCAECHSKLKTVFQPIFYRRARKIYELLDWKWRSAKEIALQLHCSVNTARKTLDFLVEKGLAEMRWGRNEQNDLMKVYRRVDET